MITNSVLSNQANEPVKLANMLSLMDDIIAVTGAQDDLRLNSYHQLVDIIEKYVFSVQMAPERLKRGWCSLWVNLKAPENLLSKKKMDNFLDEKSQLLNLFGYIPRSLLRKSCEF